VSALIRPRRLAAMLALVACFALAGPILTTASASDNSIIGTVNRWSPIVHKDEQKIEHAEQAYKSNRKAAPVVAALTHEVSDLRSFASQLKSQSASSSNGGKGRDDIASGSTLIANSYSKFASELKQAGSMGLSRAQISANAKTALAGHKKIVAGVKLLQTIG
jgi:predicted PurR-regulated permease PerM